MWRKAMVYLGLGDDAQYDDDFNRYETDDGREGGSERQQPGPRPRPTSNVSALGGQAPSADEPSGIGAVRPIGAREEGSALGPVTGQTISPRSSTNPSLPRPQVVRPIAMASSARPHIVAPTSFNEAQQVADKFKGGQPVVVNLHDGDRELSRRLIDFASGLCYGLGGQMERLDSQVYLVTPAGAEVTGEERRRLRDSGYEA